MNCEARGGDRLIKINTWSGDGLKKVLCDLKGSEKVWHYVGFRNYRSYAVRVELEGTIKTDTDANARFRRDQGAVASTIVANRWVETGLWLPKKPKGIFKGPAKEEDKFAVLESKKTGKNENVGTKVEPFLLYGRKQSFQLDMIVDT